MRHFNARFLCSALLATTFHATTAQEAPGAAIDEATATIPGVEARANSNAASLWTSIPSPQPGNCNGYDVTTMINDAVTLAQNSITVLQSLISNQVPKKNSALLDTAYSSWGVQYSTSFFSSTAKITEGQDTLKTVLNNYMTVLNILTGTTKANPKLMCTDAGWKYVTTLGQIGQSPADQPVLSTQAGASVNGYYGIMVPDIEYNSQKQLGSSLCNPYNSQGQQTVAPKAITWAKAQLIMLCPSVFNQATLASRIAAQSSLASGTTLDSQDFPGADFLHEMFHFIDQNIIDYVLDVGGEKVPAYYWDGTMMMALDPTYAKNVASNADNYRNFAIAISLNQIDWNPEGKKQ